MSKYKIVKHTRWDAADAKNHYWWTLHEWRKPLLYHIRLEYITKPKQRCEISNSSLTRHCKTRAFLV